MNTCKAALRVLFANRVLILVYVIALTALMLGMVANPIHSSAQQSAATYTPARYTVAVVNHDTQASKFAQSMREFLEVNCDVTEIGSSRQDIQRAVASNYADLVVIVPNDYMKHMTQALQDNTTVPQVETVASYTGGFGSLITAEVDDFLSLMRTRALAQSNITVTSVEQAAEQAVHTAQDKANQEPIRVVKENTSESQRTIQANHWVAYTLQSAAYPVLAAMVILSATAFAAFSNTRIQSRLFASSKRVSSLALGQIGACLLFGLVVIAFYIAACLAIVGMNGFSLNHIGIPSMMLGTITMIVYMAMAVALGYLVNAFGFNSIAANAISNVYGLIIMFTSGVSVPVDMMPSFMVTVGKLTPGWWFVQALDNAFHMNSDAQYAINVQSWAMDTGIVALFALGFACIALAIERIRRAYPQWMHATQPTFS